MEQIINWEHDRAARLERMCMDAQSRVGSFSPNLGNSFSAESGSDVGNNARYASPTKCSLRRYSNSGNEAITVPAAARKSKTLNIDVCTEQHFTQGTVSSTQKSRCASPPPPVSRCMSPVLKRSFARKLCSDERKSCIHAELHATPVGKSRFTKTEGLHLKPDVERSFVTNLKHSPRSVHEDLHDLPPHAAAKRNTSPRTPRIGASSPTSLCVGGGSEGGVGSEGRGEGDLSRPTATHSTRIVATATTANIPSKHSEMCVSDAGDRTALIAFYSRINPVRCHGSRLLSYARILQARTLTRAVSAQEWATVEKVDSVFEKYRKRARKATPLVLGASKTCTR